MVRLLCVGIVLILALYALTHGFRSRAFKVGRGQRPTAIALSSNPVGYWTMATILSVTCGACLGVILHALVHGAL